MPRGKFGRRGGEGSRFRERKLTGLADGLLAAREAEGVDGQLATVGASQLDGDLVRGEGASGMLMLGRGF